MSEINWKKEIYTIPNLLSLCRLLMIPVYLTLYQQADSSRDYLIAGSILALSCLTDMADGIIARQLHMESLVGKVLDPLADKLTQFFLLLSLAEKYTMLYPMIALFVVKEIFQLTVMVVFARNGKALKGALGAGKISTTVLFLTLTVMVLFPRLGRRVVFTMICGDILLLVFSFYDYYLAYFGKNTKLTDLSGE